MVLHICFDHVGAIVFLVCWALPQTFLEGLKFQTSYSTLHASDLWCHTL